jgi:hypothetical protein
VPRDPRREAFERVDGQYDVRVLEPSPPAVTEPPWFADDPLEGGDVLPIERSGARTWSEVAAGDRHLTSWCLDRWLIRKRLDPLPTAFIETRSALHALAEHVLAPARHQATGKIGLRFTFHGFGTPFFAGRRAPTASADKRQVRVEDDTLVVNARRHDITTLARAAEAAGVPPETQTGLYVPTTAPDPDAQLSVDPFAARALGDWYGYCASVLEQLRADADALDAPARVQLWPEHFDLAVDLGDKDSGQRANYGGSPGDEDHREPYLYVGPWGPYDAADPFWNESFGASLSYTELLAGADPLAFFRRAKELLWQANG